MLQIQVEGMSQTERDFLRSAAASPGLWKAVLALGILFMLLGVGVTVARLAIRGLDLGSEGSMMMVAGLFMVLYANLLRGAHEYLRRNGLLDEARALKRRPGT